jgi:hypothetical protein
MIPFKKNKKLKIKTKTFEDKITCIEIRSKMLLPMIVTYLNEVKIKII